MAKLQAASVPRAAAPRDIQADRRIAVLLDAPSRPYVGGGHNKHSVSVTGDRLTFFDHADSETFLKSAELTAIASSFVDDAAAA